MSNRRILLEQLGNPLPPQGTSSINQPRLPTKELQGCNEMSREDRQEWGKAFDKEYRGFKERNAYNVVRPKSGVRVIDTLTRLEYKEDHCTFLKWKARMCVRGDQQIEGDVFTASDRLMARTNTRRSCPLASQKHLRNQETARRWHIHSRNGWGGTDTLISTLKTLFS
jgi:hypothetical protein